MSKTHIYLSVMFALFALLPVSNGYSGVAIIGVLILYGLVRCDKCGSYINIRFFVPLSFNITGEICSVCGEKQNLYLLSFMKKIGLGCLPWYLSPLMFAVYVLSAIFLYTLIELFLV